MPARRVDVSSTDAIARLSRILDPYVAAQRLGLVFHPRSVVHFKGSEVEPDLMVRQQSRPGANWGDAPTPILVVEVLSSSTRRRDQVQKREFYLSAAVAGHWIVDPEAGNIRVVTAGNADNVVADALVWTPHHASGPLRISLADIFSRRASSAEAVRVKE